MLKNNPKVRDAIYETFGGCCFYTGRHIAREEMVIDHLIPLAEQGPDCIENYVLTFADLNSGKGSKVNDKILQMTCIVETVYAPRVQKILARMGKPIPQSGHIVINKEKIQLKPFRSKQKPPNYS